MTAVRKAVTKLSFIGGSLRPKGAVVHIDDEILKPRSEREGDKSGRDDNTRAANSNLVDVGKGVAQAVVAIAPISPTGPNPVRPQQLPPGTVETAAGFTNSAGAKLVAAGSELEAAAAASDAPTTAEVIEEQPERAFDHDGDGNDGGSKPQSNTVADVTASLEGADAETIDRIEAEEAAREGGARVGVTNAIEKARAALDA
jgi:hypothetical protein